MNHKCIVIYSSKTGFTETFAKWISEELSCDMVTYEKRKSIQFDRYGGIIYGGGLYAGSIRGLKWFKGKVPQWTGKKLVVFGVGATPPEAPAVAEAMEQNVSGQEQKKIKTFYFQGGLCYEKMGLIDRTLMSIFRKMLRKTEGESEAYKLLEHSFDASAREAVAPLTDYIKENWDFKMPER